MISYGQTGKFVWLGQISISITKSISKSLYLLYTDLSMQQHSKRFKLRYSKRYRNTYDQIFHALKRLLNVLSFSHGYLLGELKR